MLPTRRHFKALALALAVGAGVSGPDPAAAETPPEPGDEETAAADDGAGGSGEPVDLGSAVLGQDLGDDSIFLDPALASSEVIHVWGERPDKPFDRDTELRLTGQELAERGATDLAEALDLLPDLYVRAAGRGGRQIDIRAARKGSVKVLVDGISVSDPYYGNLDLSSIPITDIEQIRVSSQPASPIDGTGGPGGVIEVHTRDAIGAEMVRAQVRGSSLPSAEAAATARTMLGEHLAARLSAAGTVGGRVFTLQMPRGRVELDENRRQSIGAARIEHRDGPRRVVADLWMQNQSYVVPPAEEEPGDMLVIDGESQGRIGISADDRVDDWRLQARGHYQILSRRSTYYDDPELTMEIRGEDLEARRAGAALLANRAVGPTLHLIAALNADTEHADVVGFDGAEVGGRATVLQAAAGAQYERGLLDVDAAAGVAMPVGLDDASPWPEAKLAIALTPAKPLTVELTGGHKGRVPTLRERFRLDIGNTGLGPEKVLFAEAAAIVRPSEAVEARVTSYQRFTNGVIRFDGERRTLINTGDMSVRGVEARVTARPTAALETGASWAFLDAYAEELGHDPLDFQPSHRADVFASVRRRDRVGATARVSYVGEQIDRNQVIPERAIVDLTGFARLGDGLLANLRVDNALDHRYQVRSGVLAAGRVFWLTLQHEWR